MNPNVHWLTSEMAAAHLGFVKADGTPNVEAFTKWRQRHRPRQHRLGGKLRFRIVDLDRCVEIEPERKPLRAVAGGKR